MGLVRETNVQKQAKAKVKQTAQSSPRAKGPTYFEPNDPKLSKDSLAYIILQNNLLFKVIGNYEYEYVHFETNHKYKFSA